MGKKTKQKVPLDARAVLEGPLGVIDTFDMWKDGTLLMRINRDEERWIVRCVVRWFSIVPDLS